MSASPLGAAGAPNLPEVMPPERADFEIGSLRFQWSRATLGGQLQLWARGPGRRGQLTLVAKAPGPDPRVLLGAIGPYLASLTPEGRAAASAASLAAEAKKTEALEARRALAAVPHWTDKVHGFSLGVEAKAQRAREMGAPDDRGILVTAREVADKALREGLFLGTGLGRGLLIVNPTREMAALGAVISRAGDVARVARLAAGQKGTLRPNARGTAVLLRLGSGPELQAEKWQVSGAGAETCPAPTGVPQWSCDATSGHGWRLTLWETR